MIAILLVLLIAVALLALRRGAPGTPSARVASAALRWGALFAIIGLVIGVGGPHLLLPRSQDAPLLAFVVVPGTALVGAAYGAIASWVRGDRSDA